MMAKISEANFALTRYLENLVIEDMMRGRASWGVLNYWHKSSQKELSPVALMHSGKSVAKLEV